MLHPVCSARVERACEIARDGDIVVLSGWSRHPGVDPEAELMARAWHGPAVELVTETDARHTVGNAAVIAREARDAGAEELRARHVVVAQPARDVARACRSSR